MVLVYNGHSEPIGFGVEKLKRVLERCGIAYFEQYAYRGVPIIKPYELARVHMTFGYPYYIKDVKNDIMLAKQLG